MYEGIFEDVQRVKEILASHGHKSVDETLVFELLEDLKVKEQVVKVLLGTNLRASADSPTFSLGSGSNGSSQERSRYMEADEFVYYSDSSHSSDELEILKDLSYKTKNSELQNEPIDLIMEENRAMSDLLTVVQNDTKYEDSVIEVIPEELDRIGVRERDDVLARLSAIVPSDKKDISTKVEAEEELCANDRSGDNFDGKNEDVDAVNSATDSEDVEMDDYYTRPDIDSEESVGFGGSDGKISMPTSPDMRMRDELELANFEIHNNEASNLEQAENRMEEMLEENNNDPNNNLEDIQVMEQNGVSSSTTVDKPSASDKEITAGEKCLSPKPGCSKDSYYADSDGCIIKKSNARDIGTFSVDYNNMFTVLDDRANSLKNENPFSLISPMLSDEKIPSDFGIIRQVLPNVSPAQIRAHLMRNRDAINRVELALWDLLPDERPLPVLSAKRKQESDNSSSPVKKLISNYSSHSKVYDSDFPAGKERPSPHAKSNIIKPAKLSIPETKSDILHPHKLPSFLNYRSSSVGSSTKSSNSALKSKPSSLQISSSQNASKAVPSECKKMKLVPHNPQQHVKSSGVTSTQDKRAVTSSSDEADPGSKKQPFLTIQSLPSVIVKESITNLGKMNPQITGATLKEYFQSGTGLEAVSNNSIPKHSKFSYPKFYAGTVPSTSRPSGSGIQHQAPSRKVGQKSTAKLPGKESVQQNSSIDRILRITHPSQELQKITVVNQINKVMNFEGEKHAERAKPAITASEKPIVIHWTENVEAAVQIEAKAKLAVRTGEKDTTAPEKLFNQLINMFPNVDPSYISDLCIDAQLANKNLESLVEVLLVRGPEHPRIVNSEPEPQDVNPDTHYENLQGIFPDAHPEYLREMAERYYNDPEAMKDFVQAKLEKPDYPTMADYLKKIKITEQIRQYTVDFKPEKFLEIFPNPFKYFGDPKRVYRYNVIAFEFLKCHFRANKVATILKVYRHTNPQCHLTLAAKELERIGPDMKSKRADKLLPTEDIPLLQEIAFLQHKAQIEEYMTQQKLKEKEEFKRLKNNNELVECQCCFDSECMPSKCSSCSEGHIFCKSCIKLGSATKIGEGQVQFPCFVECNGEFTLPVLQNILEPTTFSILLRKRQEEEVKAAGLEGLVSCPFCHFASIPPPEDKVFKCLNPECMKESCRLCKGLNHVPLRCDEVTKGEEARRILEEKMTEALVRKCYQCSRPFFKDEGCNKMTCPCGATMCYICGEHVKDYTHFNGQGAGRADLCPLWSDNNVLNAQTVRVVAEAAEKEILKNNPHLKIDAKALMPAVPEATKGPHQDIANAHILPVHTRRA